MSLNATRGWMILGVLALALALRLTAAAWWQERLGDQHALGMPDSHGYWYLGQQLATGQPYEYGGPEFQIFRAPGYPLLLAGVFCVVGLDASMLWLRVAGAVLGTLAVGGVMWLGAVVFRHDATVRASDVALGAGLLAALYPGAIAMSMLVLAEALFCPLMVLHLIGWVKAWQAGTTLRRAGWGVAAGVACGAAVLTRPSWLLFLPFVLFWTLLISPQRGRHAWVGVCLVTGVCVAMFPWWVRSYRLVGHFVPTTLQVGASLYDGLSPMATGASDMTFADSAFEAQKAEDAAAGRTDTGFEVRLDRRLRDQAVAWAADHPRQVIELMVRKFVRMWNLWPNAAEFRSWMLRLGVAVGYVPLLILSLLGTWRWGRRGWPYVICLLPAIYFTGLHVVFVSSIRYRQPAMLVWLVLAAAVLAAGYRRVCSVREHWAGGAGPQPPALADKAAHG